MWSGYWSRDIVSYQSQPQDQPQQQPVVTPGPPFPKSLWGEGSLEPWRSYPLVCGRRSGSADAEVAREMLISCEEHSQPTAPSC